MNFRIVGTCLAGMSVGMLLPGIVHAHHGVNGQFDTTKTIEVSGVVTRVRLVNPHSYVYFDVTADDGSVEQWRCEMSSGSLLKRKGWKPAMFADGTEITINGSPARNEPNACFTETISFADGNIVGRQDSVDESFRAIREDSEGEATPVVEAPLIAGTDPVISGTWASERPDRGGPPGGNRGPRPEGAGNVERRPPPPRNDGTAEGARPDNGQQQGERPRRGPGGRGGPPQVELTEAGKAAVEGFVREDNPRFNCQATNILLDWWFDQLVNKIEQTDDSITLTYGFMDIVRTIHLNMDEHPDDIVPSIAGHSIGRWDDNVLVVDTVGFSEGYLHVPPNADGVARNSTALHIVERFTLSEDGTTLTRDYVADDSLYLVGTYTGQDVVKRTDAEYLPYDCEDLTGDTY